MALAGSYADKSAHVLRVLMVVLLGKILQDRQPMVNVSAQALMADSCSFNCLSEHMLSVITVQLLCEILSSGGGGAACLFCGDGAPVVASSCECALYYDSNPASPTAGVFWWWDATGAGQWIQFG